MAKYEEWITDEGLIKIEGWAMDGLTNEQIASNMGITRETLRVWSNKYPAVSATLKRGKEVIDRQVENALLKRALGYEYEEVKTLIEDVDGKKKKKVEKTVRHVAPDTTAQIFWLRNRTDKWSNKDNVDIEKVKADTEFVKERIKLLKGIAKDTSLMEALIDAVKGGD